MHEAYMAPAVVEVDGRLTCRSLPSSPEDEDSAPLAMVTTMKSTSSSELKGRRVHLGVIALMGEDFAAK
jgi:hypothetical protein